MRTKWEFTKETATASILDAAAVEFAEKGYNGATTRSIAARAGVSNGLITKYFATKENLLHEVIRDFRPGRIYEGITETDPYRIFCIYIEHVRRMQKENPVHFHMHLSVVHNVDFPSSIYDVIRDGFEGSLLEKALCRAQENGEIIKGDVFKIFRLFSAALYALFNRYEAIGTEAPDDDAILNILGYNRKEKIYRQQNEQMGAMEEDLGMLMAAIRETYPLSISINLTKNTYHMIDYDKFSTRKAASEGCYDDLIAVGASTVPDGTDRRKFAKLFDRVNLLEAYAKGERERSLLHLQTGDDGVDRWVETHCIMRENAAGDIVAISIGGAVNRDTVERDIADAYSEQLAKK